MRIDKYLVLIKNIPSRNKAQWLIENGFIYVNNIKINKSNIDVVDSDIIEIKETYNYVSRGAIKLLEAINIFKPDLKYKNVIDIGSSTGGFAQVLLENNINKIYCLDVGTNQLSDVIKRNPKVISIEQTNFKDVNNFMFDKIDFFTCDVSFISIEKILLKIIELNWKDIYGIILLKPQFEMDKNKMKNFKGKVNDGLLNSIKDKFKKFCFQNNIKILNIIESPIKGAKKNNTEYLVYIKT